MNKLWTVEWPQTEGRMDEGWTVVPSLKQAFKLVEGLGFKVTEVTAEEVAQAHDVTIEKAKERILPSWQNEDGSVRIEEYTESSAGPMRWRLFTSRLSDAVGL